ncbi:hypothetical protein [Bosea sp. BH3]|uniref:hypothetical protein n=1 Tax=Bosea sp. BH3 TaxID=2871701 RepID=UPI0021CB1D68|nr:hypothetical protein [Bosea sp. BH3]MCU4180111.1 hypothetical protein [Bosea sp. BH3]
MAKAKLSGDEIDQIVGMLVGWRGDLTWGRLLDKVAAVLGRPFTRQALDGHDAISRAFKSGKKRIRGAKRLNPGAPEISAELAAALERVDALQTQVALLRDERTGFLEVFATWQYNARNRGMSDRDLNLPLPTVERHATGNKRGPGKTTRDGTSSSSRR